MRQIFSIVLLLIFCIGLSAQAETTPPQEAPVVDIMEELNPFDPDVESQLETLDTIYEEETGLSPFIEPFSFMESLNLFRSKCYRSSCRVWVHVRKSAQELDLYIDGSFRETWLVSTGVSGYGTPNFDRHPNGRIYNAYSSKKYPGGNYKGLGNMPYAVFIQGGFAIHGTPEGNWSSLGRRASHGCIRVHPKNGYTLNQLVRRYGIYNTWITVN